MGDISDFFSSFMKSKGGVAALIISVLLSFGLATTVGIVPAVLADRYARINHEWDGKPCYTFDHDVIPHACVQGGDDAQTGSACMSFVQNVLLFLSNPVVGSQSDVQGRRGFLLFGISLFSLAPMALVAMHHFPMLNPFYYFAANSSTGLVSYMSIIFAAMADSSNEKFRAASYAMIMAGFYSGFCIAPSIVLFLSHEHAALLSLCLCVAAFVYAVLFFPETLPQTVAEVAAIHHAARTVNNRDGQSIDHVVPTTVTTVHDDDDIMESELTGCNHLQVIDQTTPLLSEEARLTMFVRNEQIPVVNSRHKTNSFQSLVAVIARPFREMSILYRTSFLQILTLASFLSAAVYSTDVSLVLFYIEGHLNVKDADIATMFFYMGIFGVVLQALGLQPLVSCLGEKGLLILSFLSGTLHNFLYGAARDKSAITVALSFSQFTKLNYPILSSLASKAVLADEQGQVQGALMATNALAAALGPVSMNYVYQHTKDMLYGPGTMFLLASFLYFLGTLCVAIIPMSILSESSESLSRADSNCSSSNDGASCNETTTDEANTITA
ncbi:major facilitator superfamily transporter [Nitzschia inconspicua]|uniref:Major facilitator superfamily transporter n=1 Tax=Nitzschia inconspicua TaxID=303405 RepID=A0A9K3LK84_9STRA|nr:major facilitator superfamily transporter [Nitzschia inconspicua]